MPSNLLTVKLEKFAHGGEALGHLPDGRVIFVPFALPGETVQVQVLEEKKGLLRGKPVRLLEASSRRIAPRCAHFFSFETFQGQSICGGCHYQHLPYHAQLDAKVQVLREQLMRIGNIPNPPMRSIVPSPHECYYRNHIQFHLTPEGKAGFVSHFSPESILPITQCYLPEKPLYDLWPMLEFEAGIELERIGLRLGSNEEILLVLESGLPTPPELSVEADVSVVHLWRDHAVVLAGEGHLWMDIEAPTCPPTRRTFRLSAASFFQVNTPMAGQMVAYLLKALPLSPKTVLLDVYCGVGLFSAFLAPLIQRLIAVEISPSACEDFAFNLQEYDHVKLYEAAAEQALPFLPERHVDIAIVDPPRAGLAKAALEGLVHLSPSVIAYISCEPATLARDAQRLYPHGYRLQEVTPFDLFPQTYHIESISLFEQK